MKTNIFRKNCRQFKLTAILATATAACLLAFAACQDEKEFLGNDRTPGEVVTLSLSPVLPASAGIRPLSSGDGGAGELD